MIFDYFDEIRVINLPSRKDRRALMLGELRRVGLEGDPRVEFFDALSSMYEAEMDDLLSDSDGKNVLAQRLQTKREQAADALKVANEVLAGFLKDGPTATELAAAKKNLIDGFGLRIDSNAKLLGYLSTIGFFNLPLTYLDDFPAKVAAVTAKDVRDAFARHVRPEHLVTVVVASD